MHLNLKQMNRLCPPAPSVTEWMHGHGRTAEKVQDNFKAIHLGARGARALCLREQQPHGTGERGGEVGMRLRPLAVHSGGGGTRAPTVDPRPRRSSQPPSRGWWRGPECLALGALSFVLVCLLPLFFFFNVKICKTFRAIASF